MLDAPLHGGETLVMVWRPTLKLFLQRLLILTFLTTVFLGSVALGFGYWKWILATPLLMLFWIVVFDDFDDWREHKGDVWTLTSQRLVLESATANNEFSDVALEDILKVRCFPWWVVTIKRRNRKSFTMLYLENGQDIATQLQKAADDYSKGMARDA